MERVTNERIKLYPFLQDCLKEGKHAYPRYDKQGMCMPMIKTNKYLLLLNRLGNRVAVKALNIFQIKQINFCQNQQ